MKRVLALLLVVVLSLVACGGGIEGAEVSKQPPDNINWVTPAKVVVGGWVWHCPEGHKITSIEILDEVVCDECGESYKVEASEWEDKRYYAGERVEQVMSIHNGNKELTIQRLVTTDIEDSFVEIVLGMPLYKGDLDNVLAITSRIEKEVKDPVDGVVVNPETKALDKPVATAYDAETDTLRIEGLVDLRVRILTITYVPLSLFYVQYRYPDNIDEGYMAPPVEASGWVYIEQEAMYFEPYETRDVLVALDVPIDAVLPDKPWVFWLSVKDMTQQGTVEVELGPKWIIIMREAQEGGQ